MASEQKQPKTHYDWLELDYNANDESIKAAFRRLVRLHHPDLHQNSSHAEEHFKKINAAYQVLKQPESRQRYDWSLGLTPRTASTETAKRAYSAEKETVAKASEAKETSKTQTKASPQKAATQAEEKRSKQEKKAQETPASAEGNDSKQHRTTSPKMNEDKESWLGWMESLLKSSTEEVRREAAQPYREGKTPKKPVKQGEDMTVEVSLSAHEARKGLVKTIVLDWESPCYNCASTGRINGRHCSSCNGTGQKRESRKLAVQIPLGVKQGSRVRLLGEGEPGQGGGKAGDLYLKVTLLNSDDRLEIKDNEVYLNWPVSLPNAVLGASLQVPTLHGNMPLTIPAGSQNGQVLRLKACGVKMQGQPAGDQWVTLLVDMPQKLNPEEKALYEALRKLES